MFIFIVTVKLMDLITNGRAVVKGRPPPPSDYVTWLIIVNLLGRYKQMAPKIEKIVLPFFVRFLENNPYKGFYDFELSFVFVSKMELHK